MLFLSQGRDSKEIALKQTVLGKAVSVLMRDQEDLEVRFNVVSAKLAQAQSTAAASAPAQPPAAKGMIE